MSKTTEVYSAGVFFDVDYTLTPSRPASESDPAEPATIQVEAIRICGQDLMAVLDDLVIERITNDLKGIAAELERDESEYAAESKADRMRDERRAA